MDHKEIKKKPVPLPVKAYLNEMQRRLKGLDALTRELRNTLKRLEIAVDTLIGSPAYSASDDVGFNGQAARKAIFEELISTFHFQVIVETGTWTGNTTGYMAQTSKLPVISTELDRRFYSIAKMRLDRFDNVTLENLDSRELIKKLTKYSNLANTYSFFYLDAHWYDDAPLKEEIELIAQHWDRAVMMVDDFKVPGDEGYGYDDYGEGKSLSIEYVESSLNRYNLAAFFPSKPSSEETGEKRGCIVLAKHGAVTKRLETLASLKRYEGF